MKKILVSFCGGVMALSLGIAAAHANTIIPDSGYTANAFGDGPETVGYDFTVGSNALLVTALGFWDGPQGTLQGGTTGSIGDGLANSHTLGLWDTSGNLLASTVVQAGTSDPLVGEFRFSNLLSPVTLLPGTTYVLGAFFNAGDTDTLNVIFGTFATDPAVTSGNFRESDGAFSMPADLGFKGAQIGPNAMFTLAQGVPEAGPTAILLLIAMVGLLGMRRLITSRSWLNG